MEVRRRGVLVFSREEEIFEVVDLEGKVMGSARRSEVHGNPHLIHRVVHCLIFNSQGNLFLQKRSLIKDIQPGKWDTSVGGHMDPGETPQEAVARETREELGIENVSFQFLYRYVMSNEIETELVDTFRAVHDGPFELNPQEISEGRFWKAEEIKNSIDPNIFTPNFMDEWNRWQLHVNNQRGLNECSDH